MRCAVRGVRVRSGAHLALHPLGMWWAATSLEVWPDSGNSASAEVGKVLEEFDLSSRWGDRRQELVFIGIGKRGTRCGGSTVFEETGHMAEALLGRQADTSQGHRQAHTDRCPTRQTFPYSCSTLCGPTGRV